MKIVFYLITFIAFGSCSKNDNAEPTIFNNATGQNISILIQPNLTDANYASTNQSHYVVRNTNTHLNKLLLFIGGSFSAPKD